MKVRKGDTVRILHRNMWIVGEVLVHAGDLVLVRDTFSHRLDREYNGETFHVSTIREILPCANCQS